MSRFSNWKHPLFKDGYSYERIEGEDTFIGRKQLYGKKYGWRCLNSENLKLGKNTDIGCFTLLNAKYGIEIGDNVQIGAHCAIYTSNTQNNTKGKVIIGENSKIGSYTLILPGVFILPNSKIKARSIIK